MAYFGVAHVVVGGESDGGAVGAELCEEWFLEELIEGGGIGGPYAVGFVLGADADAVHDDKNEWSWVGGVVGQGV